MATKDLTVNINHIDPRVNDTFGFQVSKNGEAVTFTDGIGWNKTFVEELKTIQPLNKITKFSSDLEVEDLFRPITGVVYDSLIQSDGKIIIVGNISFYDGTPVKNVVRINTDGSLDTSFTVNTNGTVTCIAETGTAYYFGGDFTNVNFNVINRIAKTNKTTGALSLTFRNSIMSDATSPGANGTVTCITPDASGGNLYVGGYFTRFNSTSQNRKAFVRINDLGSVSTNTVGYVMSAPNTNTFVNSISIQDDGKILLGGNITDYIPLGSFSPILTGVGLVRINQNFSGDSNFFGSTIFTGNNTGFNGTVRKAFSDSSYVYVVGDFTTLNGSTARSIVRLDKVTGSLSTNYSGGALGGINDIQILSTGDIILCGGFTQWQTTDVGGLIRISSTGVLEESIILNSYATSITKLSASDSFLLGGNFSNAVIDSSLDNTFLSIPLVYGDDLNFSSAFNGNINKILKNPIEENYLVCGEFTEYKGLPANKVCKIDFSGNLVDALTSTTTDVENNIGILDDGSIFFIGENFNGTSLAPYGYFIKTDNDFNINSVFNSTNDGFDVFYTSLVTKTFNNNIIVICNQNIINYNGVEYDAPYGGKILTIEPNSGDLIDYSSKPRYFDRLESKNNGDFIYFNLNSGVIRSTVREGLINYNKNLNQEFGMSFVDGRLLALGDYSIFGNNTIELEYGVFAEDLIILSEDCNTLLKYNSGAGFNQKIYNGLYLDKREKIYVVSSISTPFSTYNGESCGMIARFNQNLEIDNTFNTSFSFAGGQINDILFENTHIILVGDFTSVNGQPVQKIAYLDYEGNLINKVVDVDQTVTNTYNNLVTFNSGDGITYTRSGNIITMVYVSEDVDIVTFDYFDTLEHVEINYILEVPVFEDIVTDAVTRSPIFYNTDATNLSTVDYEVKAFEGNIFSAQPILTTVRKSKIITTQEGIYFDASEYLSEKLEVTPTTFLDVNYNDVKNLPPNFSKWALVTERRYLLNTLIDEKKNYNFIIDGYLEEFEQQGLPNILMNGLERDLIVGQNYQLFFKTNKLLSISMEVDGVSSSITLPPTILFLNTEYVKYLNVDSRLGKRIKYIFAYESSTIEVVFNCYEQCKFANQYLVFKNKYGVLDTLPVNKKSVKVLNTTKTDFKRSIVDFNGNFNELDHTNKVFNLNGVETLTLNTPLLPEYMNKAIQDISLSEQIWLFDGTRLTPVLKDEDNITYKTSLNDKMVQYTLRVKKSHSKIKQIK